MRQATIEIMKGLDKWYKHNDGYTIGVVYLHRGLAVHSILQLFVFYK